MMQRRRAARRRFWFYGCLLTALAFFVAYMTEMPGSSHTGPVPKPSGELSELATALQGHVATLSVQIGERRIGHGESLEAARNYVASVGRDIARATELELDFESLGPSGSDARNLVVEIPGASHELVIIGAHYDSAPGSPGANDNASGVAAGLELLRMFSTGGLARTLRFVFFANEEPPYFQNAGMGSLEHARGCRERGEAVAAMLSLEPLGFYSEEPESQRYPWPIGLLYPDRGNFVAFVGNLTSRALVRRAIHLFRESTPFPSEGAALPGAVPGVGWSDHWSFWQFGYSAIMVTDTAVYRDPHYHEHGDVPVNIAFDKLARVTLGLRFVLEGIANDG